MNKRIIFEHLKILGIPLEVDFTKQDIKSNFKTMAKLLHPDMKKIDDRGNQFKKLKAAEEFLLTNFNEIKALKIHQKLGNYSNPDFNNYQSKSQKRDNDNKSRQKETELREAHREEQRRKYKGKQEKAKREEKEKRQRERKEFILNLKGLINKGDFKICIDKLKKNEILNQDDSIYIEIYFLAFHKIRNIEEFIEKYKNEQLMDILIKLTSTDAYKNYVKVTKNLNFIEMNKYFNSKVNSYYQSLKKERKKKAIRNIKKFLLYDIPCLVIILLAILTPTYLIPSNNYNKAIDYIEQGNYQEAERIFNNIEGFSDSNNQIIIVNAHEEFDSGNFEVAIDLIEEIGKVNIEYDLDGGQSISQLSLSNMSSLSNSIPFKEGYTFLDWELVSYSINNERNNYSANVNLKALWISNQYTITFDSNGGSFIEPITEDYNSTINQPDMPYKEGYTFIDWYIDESFTQKYSFSTMPAENITIYARWQVTPYTITLMLNNGEGTISITENFNTVLTEPIPLREGHSFDGWYKDNGFTELYIFNTMPAENLTLYAKWSINQYTVIFDSNEGTIVESIIEDYDVVINKPINPTRDGYSFDGWYMDNEFAMPYTFSRMPAEDITLYAKWAPLSFTLSFDLLDDKMIFDYNDLIVDLPIPEMKGYSFDGWYINGHVIDGETKWTFLSDMQATAHFTINQYTMSFNTTDGTIINSYVQYYDTKVVQPNDPERRGYIFIGWYHNDESYIFDKMPAQNIQRNTRLLLLEPQLRLMFYMASK